MTRQAVAKHLATLADAGLVESERQGRETRYRLTEAGAEWDDRLDALARHLQRRRSVSSQRWRRMTLSGTCRSRSRATSSSRSSRRSHVSSRCAARSSCCAASGEEGRGEEVDYDPQAQQQFQARRNELPFAGEHTLDSFSLLQAGQTEYRRWAFESAALDLALRQAGRRSARRSAASRGRVRFVVSTRDRERAGLARPLPGHPLQARPDRNWTDEIVDASVARGRRRHRRLQRGLPRRLRLAAGPRAVRADRRRRSRRRGSRTPRSRARRRARSSRTATGSRGTRRSTSGATSRRFRSVRAA